MISWLRRLANPHPVSEGDLSAYVDGQLPGESLDAVEAHLQGCDSCRAKVAETRALKAMLGALPIAQPRRSFALTAEMAGTAPPAAPRRASGWAFAPAAALTLFLALVAVDVLGPGTRSSSDDATLATAAMDKAGEAESSAFTSPPAVPAVGRESLTPQATPAARASGAETDTGRAPAAEPAAGQGAPGAAPGPDGAQATGQQAEDEDGGISLLRALQVAALVLFAGSAFYAWNRYRASSHARSP